jgi:hypothetical protein
MLSIAAAAACFLLTLPASAQSYTETFTGGVNQGGWTWGNPADSIQPTGGNPGAYLRNDNLDTFAPQPRTTAGAGSPFGGDYRARGVQSVGIDLITHATQFNFSREVTLMLGDGSGCFVYFISPYFVPQVGAGWASYDIPVPSASTTLPAGWQVDASCAGTPDQIWNAIIQNVVEVRWFYGDPTFFFIFDIWQVGLDNARIGAELGTAACAGDGTGTACPCGNDGAAGQGCRNSTGQGAVLTAGGSASFAANDTTFTASGMPSTSPVLLFRGTSLLGGGAGVTFGDGLRCAGGTVTRIGIRTAVGGSATWGPGLNLSGTPGQPVHFQAWYRNVVGPCGSGFNLTNARTIVFQA